MIETVGEIGIALDNGFVLVDLTRTWLLSKEGSLYTVFNLIGECRLMRTASGCTDIAILIKGISSESLQWRVLKS